MASPSLSDTDRDGLPRRVDRPDVADTGNGSAPLVEIGAYEVEILA